MRLDDARERVHACWGGRRRGPDGRETRERGRGRATGTKATCARGPDEEESVGGRGRERVRVAGREGAGGAFSLARWHAARARTHGAAARPPAGETPAGRHDTSTRSQTPVPPRPLPTATSDASPQRPAASWPISRIVCEMASHEMWSPSSAAAPQAAEVMGQRNRPAADPCPGTQDDRMTNVEDDNAAKPPSDKSQTTAPDENETSIKRQLQRNGKGAFCNGRQRLETRLSPGELQRLSDAAR